MSKTLEEYVEGLVKFLKDNPGAKSYLVVTSKDEGNGYNTVRQTPTICYNDADANGTIDDDEDYRYRSVVRVN